MSNIIIGSIALGVAITLMIFKKKGRLLTIMALIAGLAATPMLQGLLGGLLSGLDAAIGVGVPLVLAAMASVWLVFELKETGTRTLTPWIALVTPALWILAAGPFLLLLSLGQGGLDMGEHALSAISGIGR